MSPALAITASSGVQVMWNPGVATPSDTIFRIASLPAMVGAPGWTTRASSVQNVTVLSTLPDDATAAQARSAARSASRSAGDPPAAAFTGSSASLAAHPMAQANVQRNSARVVIEIAVRGD